MGKYEPLSKHLREVGLNHVPMNFEEIERVLGFPLPASSRKHRAWWSNNASNNVMTHAWIDAGYRTEDVDIEHRRLVFRRVEGGKDRTARASGAGAPPQAKSIIGCLRGTVTFVAGVDLTEPADPDWGKRAYGDANDEGRDAR